MAKIADATSAIASANYRSPKTILGFFAIVLGILFSAAVFVVGILARTPELRGLVTPILVFAAVLIVVVLAGVFVTAWKDPTILMLGQVTGEVYMENRKLTLGDSTAGEFTQDVLIPTTTVQVSAGLLPSAAPETSGDSQETGQ